MDSVSYEITNFNWGRMKLRLYRVGFALMFSLSQGCQESTAGEPAVEKKPKVSTSDQVKKSWREPIARNEDHLVKIISDCNRLTTDEKKFRLNLLKEVLSDSVDLGQLRTFYTITAGFGLLRDDGTLRLTIQSDWIYEILIGGLESTDRLTRNVATSKLMELSARSLLFRQKEFILNTTRNTRNLQNFHLSDVLELLGLLLLTQSEREEFFGEVKSLPRKISAVLGDSIAEAKIIQQFTNAKTFDEKSFATRDLGYVASENCAKALVRDLFVPLIWEASGDAVGRISIQNSIITALAKIYPEEKIFGSRLYEVSTQNAVMTKPEMDLGKTVGNRRARLLYRERRSEEVKSYFLEVSDWAFQKFGLRPKDPLPEITILSD